MAFKKPSPLPSGYSSSFCFRNSAPCPVSALLSDLPSTSPPEAAILERCRYVVPTTSFLVRRSLCERTGEGLYPGIYTLTQQQSGGAGKVPRPQKSSCPMGLKLYCTLRITWKPQLSSPLQALDLIKAGVENRNLHLHKYISQLILIQMALQPPTEKRDSVKSFQLWKLRFVHRGQGICL